MIDPITQYILDQQEDISYHDREYVDQRAEERERQLRDRQRRRERDEERPSRWDRRSYGRY